MNYFREFKETLISFETVADVKLNYFLYSWFNIITKDEVQFAFVAKKLEEIRSAFFKFLRAEHHKIKLLRPYLHNQCWTEALQDLEIHHVELKQHRDSVEQSILQLAQEIIGHFEEKQVWQKIKNTMALNDQKFQFTTEISLLPYDLYYFHLQQNYEEMKICLEKLRLK